MTKPTDLLYQLLQSRIGAALSFTGATALIAAAFVRLIPWWLCILILVLIVVGVIAYSVVSQWWASRKDDHLVEGLDAQSASEVGRQRVRDREALKALHAQWKESLEQLRKSRVGKRRRALYFLPWYVIIGAPASGKSTAIKNSGLHFPMGEPKLGGTGGTRNCDWWFADEAIILDTAGRYTFGDEHEPDRDEWLSFLKLLRKNRARSPINGLIVAVSADELMSKDRDEIVNDARNIRHKIDQLVRELAIHFPVYLLITKCDLIEGFTEFFGRLPKKRLDEMLGWTNPSLNADDPRRVVAEALDALRERAVAMRIGFLWEEERADALRKIYLFPEELRVFNSSLADFCDVLLRESQYDESPFLRGIYLSSGMQKGTAVSRMLDRLGLPAYASELREEKRSYFLKDFFQTRLPADSNLVATTGHARGRLRVVHNFGLALIAALCVLAVILTGTSYIANRTLLLDVQDEMRAAISAAPRPPDERIAALDNYVDAIERLEDRNRRRPLLAGWGLYTGYQVIEPARALFLRNFQQQAYVPAVAAARQALQAQQPARGFAALDALIRDYLLSKLLNGTHAEPLGPNDSLAEFWAGTGSTSGEVLAHYARGYHAYLRWRDAATAQGDDASDLGAVRQALPQLFTVDRVTAWVDGLVPAFTAQDLPVPASIGNRAHVRGSFTPPAWNDRIAPLTDTVDLIAKDIDPTLTSRFRDEYARRYFAEWLQFVTVPSDTQDGGLSVAQLLGEESPYLKVVDRTAAATALTIEGTTKPAWTGPVGTVSGDRRAYLDALDKIQRRLVAAQEDPAAALQDAKDIFSGHVRAASTDDHTGPSDPFGAAEQWVKTTVKPAAGADHDDERVRARVTALLLAPVYNAFGAYLRIVGHEIDGQWQGRIVNRFQGDAMAPGNEALSGELQKFYDEYLDPFLERANLAPKERYTKKLPVSADLGPYLRRIDGQNAVLFGPGGTYRHHNIRFETVPTEDPGTGGTRVTRTVLTVACGEKEPWELEHRQFRASKAIQWSPDVCGRAELTVFVGSPDGSEHSLDSIVADGPMGLLHLLQQAHVAGDHFSWTFPGDFTATFIVTLPRELLGLTTEGNRPPSTIMQ